MTVRRLAAGLFLAAVLLGACGGGDDTAAPMAATPRASVRTTSAPKDFGIQKYSGEPNGSGLCGEYSVVWQSPAQGGGRRASLSAVAGEKVVLDLEGKDEFEQLIALWCGDVDADGRVELATEVYTGGAHCCYHVRVDTLDGPNLLDIDLGNAGDPQPKQLDAGGPYELATWSDVLAYFDDLPYAASPVLPRVFALKEGQYVDATTEFPAHVRKSLEEWKDDLEAAVERKEDVQGIEGLAIGVYGHYVLLDEETSGLDDVANSVPDEIAQWLRDNADAAVSLIRGEKEK